MYLGWSPYTVCPFQSLSELVFSFVKLKSLFHKAVVPVNCIEQSESAQHTVNAQQLFTIYYLLQFKLTRKAKYFQAIRILIVKGRKKPSNHLSI